MSPSQVPERVVRWFDDVQQARWWLAMPVAVVRKYADDRASTFAGVVTYQIFLGMLPLLVVVLTVFATVLEGSPELREAALESTLAQLPVVGERLESDIGALAVDGPWIIVSIAGLLWTAVGIYTGLQLALNQVWNVEGIHRQGFVSRLVRAVLLFVLLIVAAVGTAPIRGDVFPGQLPELVGDVASALVGSVLAALLLLGVFRIVVAPVVPTLRLVPAALLAGLLWELLQSIGASLLVDQLADARTIYGGIAVVVVTLLWINLLARAVLFANEWAVVGWDHLWPRRIAQPPLTDADRRVLVRLAGNERRRPEEHIDVRFD